MAASEQARFFTRLFCSLFAPFFTGIEGRIGEGPLTSGPRVEGVVDQSNLSILEVSFCSVR